MLRRTRISRNMDTGRLGAAVSRPGIDPRAWVSLAVALGESKVDPQYGVFVNVQLMPTGETYTASVLAQYAGKGFGLYTEILPNDDLVVAIPSGDPRIGVVVLGRMWTAADTPPTEATADPTEAMLVVEPGKNLRLKVTGSGKVEIDSETTVTVNCPDIRLGDPDPADPATLAPATLANFNAIKSAMSGAVVIPGDGGASLKATFLTGLDLALTPDTYPKAVAAQTTKVK